MWPWIPAFAGMTMGESEHLSLTSSLNNLALELQDPLARCAKKM